MARFTIAFISLLFFAISCTNTSPKNSTQFSLKGKAIGYPNNTIILEQIQFGYNTPVDTTITNANGEFEFSGVIKELGLFNVSIDNEKHKNIFILLDSNTIGQIEFVFDSMGTTSTLQNTPDCDEINSFYKGLAQSKIYMKKYIDSNVAFNKELQTRMYPRWSNMSIYDGTFVGALDSTLVKQLNTFNTKAEGEKFKWMYVLYLDSAIKTYNSSMVSLIPYNMMHPFDGMAGFNNKTARGLKPFDSPNILDAISNLKTKYPSNNYLREFEKNVLAVKEIIRKDSTLKDIALPDDKGNMVHLKDVIKPFTLLYFWSSWNKYAPVQIQQIKKLQNEYIGIADILVVTVSIDKNEADWIAAIEKNKINSWVSLIDKKGLESEYLKKYNANMLPYFSLIVDNKIVSSYMSIYLLNRGFKNHIPVSFNSHTKKL